MVDPLCKPGCRHSLTIAGPGLGKSRHRKSGAARSPLRAPLEVPQKQSLMTSVLPDQTQARLVGRRRDPGISVGTDPQLVVIEQYEAPFESSVALFPFTGTLYRQIHQRRGVSTARLQQHGIEMHGEPLRFGKPGEQRDIALFAFALAADEDTAALRDDLALLAAHPIWGRAP